MVRTRVPYAASETWDGSLDDPDDWNIYQADPTHESNRERASKDPVRLGIVGTGGVSQGKHLPSINRLKTIGDPVEIVAVADIDEAAGKQTADIYGVEYYEDYNEMVDEEEIDAVDHTTASGAAGPILGDLLERGLHVFREKPLLFEGYENLDETTEKARELCELADEEDLVLMTGYCKRFSPPYANARYFIDRGEIGEPSMIQSKMVQAWTPDRLFEEQATHVIDLNRFFMGEVESVWADGVNKYGVDSYDIDNAIINFRFENDTVGALTTSNSTPNLKPWERVEIYGDDAYIRVEDQNDLYLYDEEEGPTKSWSPTPPNTLLWDEEFGGYVWELENFLDAVRGIDEPRVTGWDGYAALEIARAAHKSIATGESVEVRSP